MNKTVSVGDIRSTAWGFSRLATLSSELGQFWLEDIEVDFSYCNWFDANMSAPLSVILAQSEVYNQVKPIKIPPQIENILRKNKFLKQYGRDEIPDTYGTTIPFLHIQDKDGKAFASYINKYLKGNGMPQMSDALNRRFKESILELFDNALFHSETKLGIYVCGQYFPSKKLIEFSIADAGIGIRKKIRKELGFKMNSDQAIEWALQEGHTTRKGNVPGGLGLKLLKEFIALNEGRIQIVSDRGYWEFNRATEKLERMEHSFPGTVINIEINTSDTSKYYLSSEQKK